MYSIVYAMLSCLRRAGLKKRQYTKILERTQWLSRAELNEVQFGKIKDILNYAYQHVPYYRKIYKHEGIHPEDIKSLKDFETLPFINKDEVNKNLHSLVSPEYKNKVFRDQTGGSTGKPMRFFSDHFSSLWGGAIRDRGRSWHGINQGAKIAWVWGDPRDMKNKKISDRFINLIKRNRYLNAYEMTTDRMQDFAELLVKWQPDLIRAYPSALTAFAGFLNKNGLKKIKPKLIETTSEVLTKQQRQFFEEFFQCSVAECYSSREMYEMAYQCHYGGFHVSETIYMELVDGEHVVSDHSIGEVVVTSLTKFAMPFIRYKTDDLAIFETKDCSCGRKLPILKEIVGRAEDCIITENGKTVTGSYFDSVFWNRSEVKQFQVHQKNIRNIDIRMVCRTDINSSWLDNLKSKLKRKFGEKMQISFSIVDKIELTPAGKYRYVISDIGKNQQPTTKRAKLNI